MLSAHVSMGFPFSLLGFGNTAHHSPKGVARCFDNFSFRHIPTEFKRAVHNLAQSSFDFIHNFE